VVFKNVNIDSCSSVKLVLIVSVTFMNNHSLFDTTWIEVNNSRFADIAK